MDFDIVQLMSEILEKTGAEYIGIHLIKGGTNFNATLSREDKGGKREEDE